MTRNLQETLDAIRAANANGTTFTVAVDLHRILTRGLH
jgi:hypothetical protein